MLTFLKLYLEFYFLNFRTKLINITLMYIILFYYYVRILILFLNISTELNTFKGDFKRQSNNILRQFNC